MYVYLCKLKIEISINILQICIYRGITHTFYNLNSQNSFYLYFNDCNILITDLYFVINVHVI